MRRSTIVGPLILIALGVLFLLKNIRPELRIFETFIEYWPILLIVWGVIRVIDVLASYRGGRLPAARAGVTGGEWALIFLVTLFGAGAWGVQKFAATAPGKIRIGGVDMFGETFDYPVQSVRKSGKPVRVVVDNLRGNCRITGSDAAEVTVSGRKTIRAMDRNEADRAAEKTPIEVTEAGDTITIRSNLERADQPRVSADLEITIPRNASVEARGRYGDFDISDVNGSVTIDSDNAGVRLQNIASKATVSLRKSDIIRAIGIKGDLELKGTGRDIEIENVSGQVTIDGSYSGETLVRNVAKSLRFQSRVTDFRVERIPGELQITLANLSGENLVGPLRLTARSKDVRLSDVTDAIEIEVERGDVELRQAKGPVARTVIRVESGDIELAIPQNSKIQMDASTSHGSISNDFSTALKEESAGRGAKLRGGEATGPEMRLSTNRGEITVRKVIAGEISSIEQPRPPRAPKVPPPPPPRADNQ